MKNSKQNNIYQFTGNSENPNNNRRYQELNQQKPEPVKKLTLSDWVVILFMIYIGFAGVYAPW